MTIADGILDASALADLGAALSQDIVKSVRMFGANGDGLTDDTAALIAAHTWLQTTASTGVAAKLIYHGGNYRVSDELPLPDASGWEIEAAGYVTVTQTTDNKIIWSMQVSAPRNRFKIRGAFRFTWINVQPSSNTRSIAIAFGSTVEVTDGIYDFEVDNVVFSRGFRGISVHPDTIVANYRFPVWGAQFNRITSFREMTGATMRLFSPNPNVGSPRISINHFYAQGENATEARLSLDGFSQVDIRLLEFNLGSGPQLSITNCRQVLIDQARLEGASISTNSGRVMEFSGSTSQVIIRNFELQTFTTNVSTEAYVINSDQGVVTVENIDVIDVTTTSGSLYLLNRTGNGVVIYLGDLRFANENNTFLHSASAAPGITPGRKQEFTFSLSNITANTSTTQLLNGKPANLEMIGSPCYLVGFLVRITSPLTSGTVNVQANKNGGQIASGQYSAQLSTGLNSTSRYHPCWKGFFTPRQDHKFLAGESLTFTYDTSSGFAPTGGTLRVVAILASVPR